jgi:hypothetical protein
MPPGYRARLLFEDEARFGRISDVRRCWAPAPWRPIAPHQQVRKYINALAAVSPLDGALSSLLCAGLDAPVMTAFLAQIRAQFPSDFCIIVLNGAGHHIARDLVVPPAMHLELLPAHSPELNPVEEIWDYVRDHYTGNRAFPSLPHVEEALCTAFQDLGRQPKLLRSMTLYDWINRAILTTT